jgi:hypothetical protein
MATILCAAPRTVEELPLRQAFYYGSMPRHAHVYAWLEPIPVAAKICAESGSEVVDIGSATLYQLELEVQDSTHRADPTWPCGRQPWKESPTTYAVTFDPDHKTWEERDGEWIERRTLTLE